MKFSLPCPVCLTAAMKGDIIPDLRPDQRNAGSPAALRGRGLPYQSTGRF